MYQRSRLTVTFGVTVLVMCSAVASEVISPFNGKDLSGWTTKEPNARSHWAVGIAALKRDNAGEIELAPAKDADRGELVNTQGHGVDAYTLEKFGDVRIELEVMVPQGSNSGIYVMGEYEVQVFDSFGKEELGGGDMGAIYGATPPRANATKRPGQWNKYVIEFRAPKFDDNGNKTKNALFIKVALNGAVLQEQVEMEGPTPGGITGKEQVRGPLMFQGDHGPVAYRKIQITPLN